MSQVVQEPGIRYNRYTLIARGDGLGDIPSDGGLDTSSQPVAYRQCAAQLVGAGSSIVRAIPFLLWPVALYLPAVRVSYPEVAVCIAAISSVRSGSGLQTAIGSIR